MLCSVLKVCTVILLLLFLFGKIVCSAYFLFCTDLYNSTKRSYGKTKMKKIDIKISFNFSHINFYDTLLKFYLLKFFTINFLFIFPICNVYFSNYSFCTWWRIVKKEFLRTPTLILHNLLIMKKKFKRGLRFSMSLTCIAYDS